MDLHTYISDAAQRAFLAKATNSSPDYLWQVATGRRRASPDLAKAIDAATSGEVSKESLRPDLWADQPPAAQVA